MFRHALRRAALSRLPLCRNSPILQLYQTCLNPAGSCDLCSSAPLLRQFSGSVTGARGLTKSSLPSGNDTIYALSSGAGRAGIAVIRVSGRGCVDVYNGLCPTKPLPKARYAAVRTLIEPGSGRADSSGNIVDSDALVLYFPGPKTVTGEDVLELHVHGGTATVKAVLAAIPRCTTSPSTTIRYAEPGEFTRRAFLNDRLDLAQVESLGDTLAAETEQQRRAAVRGNSGILGKTYEAWRSQLLLARGEIEALIDFSEDQHFDESPRELLTNVSRLVDGILRSIRLHEMGSQRSELLRNGIRIALLGPPNVGKSSLMNQIVGREASIVSSEAGTTRDIVEASLDIRGYLCSFADTAGIRTHSPAPRGRSGGESSSSSLGDAAAAAAASPIGAIEEEGIRRARKKAEDSDIIIVLTSVEPTDAGGYHISHDTETLQLAAKAEQCLVVVNKCDVITDTQTLQSLVQDFKSELKRIGINSQGVQVEEPLTISCYAAEAAQAQEEGEVGDVSDKDNMSASVGLTHMNAPTQGNTQKHVGVRMGGGDVSGGIQTLVEKLVQSFSSLTSLPGGDSDMQYLLGVTERQRQLLVQCRGHLEDFSDEVTQQTAETSDYNEEVVEPDIVLAAEHLRLAANCLAMITGRGEAGDVEEVLGVIFEKFCVGK
ncbi:hypothetical protein QBC46DRAFT_375555 [Diplogelasinospora grovesii]|uniref:Uncharacterized protein n=1 Tax=Diplogelasinospora grovesii TaxID=303347 RepID=A0AAN6NEA7_9PEZI|nr:hypothetical protein QBC46DRAFT_375555 [Diplogelasinospora grovesii]